MQSKIRSLRPTPSVEKIVFPFLRTSIIPSPTGRILIGNTVEQDVPPEWVPVIDAILYDALDLRGVAKRVRQINGKVPGESLEGTERRIGAALRYQSNVVGLAELKLPQKFDAVMVCQGYAGVFVHTVQLWKELNKHYKVLLISPVEPPYGLSRGMKENLLVFQTLQKRGFPATYLSFVHLVRALVGTLEYDLLYLEHRTQSLFLFDLLKRAKKGAIIHDDGFFDSVFHAGLVGRVTHEEHRRRLILREVYHALRQSPLGFYGMTAHPLTNRRILEAGWLALQAASENWCWSKPNFDIMRGLYERAGSRFRFVPPMVDTSLRVNGVTPRKNRILFTTTMHNINEKGIIELGRAMKYVPEDIRVICVIAQPEQIPKSARKLIGNRFILRKPMPKTKLVELYHNVALNCRVSRSESSPVSILEGMACGLPIITSTNVHQNVPILEDGKTGFILDPDAPPKVLAERITRICRDADLRDAMSRECRRRVRSYGMKSNLPLLTRYMKNGTA